MRFEAKHRYVRIAPRKARYVIDQIRGRHVDEALTILKYSKRRAAYFIRKVVDSAFANAQNNHDHDGSGLRVVEARIDPGPTMKRFMPRSMGRAYPILKRTSHIVIVLADPNESEE